MMGSIVQPLSIRDQDCRPVRSRALRHQSDRLSCSSSALFLPHGGNLGFPPMKASSTSYTPDQTASDPVDDLHELANGVGEFHQFLGSRPTALTSPPEDGPWRTSNHEEHRRDPDAQVELRRVRVWRSFEVTVN